MPSLAVLVVVALAAFRITRLVTTDTLTRPLRDRVYAWAWDDEHTTRGADGYLYPTARGPIRTYLHELYVCPWCLGVWISGGTYALWDHGGSVGHTIVAVAAVAGVQGIAAHYTPEPTNGNGDDE